MFVFVFTFDYMKILTDEYMNECMFLYFNIVVCISMLIFAGVY